MSTAAARYPLITIVLHWVIALAILLMLASGLTMAYAPLPPMFKFQLFQWHKALGVLILLAVTLRIVTTLLTLRQRPPLPAAMPRWERTAAHLGHLALYVWMFALPLTGWLMVSASAFGLPTIVFGLFVWPHIPGVAGNEVLAGLAAQSHQLLAFSLLALLAGHIGAAFKHRLIDHHNLFPRIGLGRSHS